MQEQSEATYHKEGDWIHKFTFREGKHTVKWDWRFGGLGQSTITIDDTVVSEERISMLKPTTFIKHTFSHDDVEYTIISTPQILTRGGGMRITLQKADKVYRSFRIDEKERFKYYGFGIVFLIFATLFLFFTKIHPSLFEFLIYIVMLPGAGYEVYRQIKDNKKPKKVVEENISPQNT